ncbi:hypothetical protein OROHE_023272 [Orobanche hederae]
MVIPVSSSALAANHKLNWQGSSAQIRNVSTHTQIGV